MKILDKVPTTKAGPDRFIGDAWFDLIVRGQPPSRVRASIVRFAPGARNHWHRHAVGQTFHVTDGVGRPQARGGDLPAPRRTGATQSATMSIPLRRRCTTVEPAAWRVV